MIIVLIQYSAENVCYGLFTDKQEICLVNKYITLSQAEVIMRDSIHSQNGYIKLKRLLINIL
jgi:hypothetical protein